MVGLLVIVMVGDCEFYWVCVIYLVLLVVVGFGVVLYMDNLMEYCIELNIMCVVVFELYIWVILLLYIGIFGLFIGFFFVFG